jgi:SAM-dependent methyltransferase
VVEVHGTDIDAEMIAWLQANVRYGQYVVGPHEPPLPYPEHYFDLVINHSVFSHLDERLQDLWLGELQRITRPGALLLLTVEGESSWNRTVEAAEGAGEDVEPWREELENRGILYIADDQYIGSTHPDFYHSTVHAPWYVFEHWSRFFDIACFIPDGSLSQDLIVLRRREDGASPRPIVGRRTSTAAARGPVSPPFRPRLAAATARVERLVRRWSNVMPSRRAPNSGPIQTRQSAKMQRELSMLRVGLYEQGRRITVLGAELRKEIDDVRNGAEHGNGRNERER